MPTSYRSLAVARATATNNRRLAVLVAFTVATALLARLEFPASRAGFTLFALWLLATLAFGIVLRGIAHRTLTRYGYTVLVARSGAEAMSVHEHYSGHIQLLLTDLMMPEMTGHELAKRLQAERTGLKLLFMSGYTEGSVLGRNDGARGASFIGKPFTPDDLARRVKEVLLS